MSWLRSYGEYRITQWRVWVRDLVDFATEDSCSYGEGYLFFWREGFLWGGTFGIAGLCGVGPRKPRGRRGGGKRRVLLGLL